MPFLKIENMCKSFGGLMAISHLDLDMEEGQSLGLIGPNGSGKTTALNLITGFLKPDTGRIVFRDENIAGLPRYRVCQKGIARTFQIIKPFLDFTALENVMAGRSFGHQPAANLKIAAKESRELLDRVGLGDKAEVKAKDLSLMQRKRLELARALGARPYLLLLDELMAGLNPSETDEACSLIKSIRDQGMTMIVVEHIVKAICDLSDHVVVLNMGEKIAEGPSQDIICNQQVVEVYLGKAYA